MGHVVSDKLKKNINSNLTQLKAQNKILTQLNPPTHKYQL